MRSLMVALVLCVTPSIVTAQQSETLRTGAKVRMVLADGSKAKGFVDAATDEKIELRIAKQDATTTSFDRRSIKWVEVEKRRTARGALKGGLLGLLIGGGGGFLIGAAAYDGCDILVCSRTESGMFLGFIAGTVAIPIGLMVGAAKGDPEWVPVNSVAASKSP